TLSYSTLGNMAICYKNLKDYTTANSYYLKAIETAIQHFKGNNHVKIALHYMNYGYFLNIKKDYVNSIKYFSKALSIYGQNYSNHPDLSQCYNNLGEYFISTNQSDSALYYFQKSLIALSLEFNDKSFYSNPTVDQVLSKTHLLGTLKNKAYTLSIIASQNNDVNYYKQSLITYDLAIEAIDKIRSGYISEESKLFLADNEFETFSNALQACYDLYKKTQENKYLEKALNYSEAGKSAVLSEALQNIQALNIGGIPDSLIIQEKQLEKSIWGYEELIYEEKKEKNPNQNKLEYWNKYLFEEKQKYDELISNLENNYQEYYNLKHVQNKITISEIQKNLKQKDLLVEYFYTDDKIYTFTINKHNSDIIVSKVDSLFHNHLESFLESLSDNNFSNHGYEEFNQYQESSYFIYSQLLKPIEKKVRNKNLIIIPDGKLAYLPFEVLTKENVQFERINYKGLSYLLHDHNFNYSYSASFLFENNKRKTASKKLGAFAPTYNNIKGLPDNVSSLRQEYRERLFPLKGIKVEVQTITKLLNGDSFIDNEASETRFKEVASRYDILHLAMHTIMDDENPMYSKMAFTQQADSSEDGFLNTYELYNMRLNSRMAVLSSCNSGSGKLHRGEGVMSMARGFIYSGCPSIVMTLWSVEDKSGVKLMTSFYENLLRGRTKSESLRLSKINFINNADQLKAHPYFWSGYVVIGNNNALFVAYRMYLIYLGIVILFVISGVMVRLRKKRINSSASK
ncbi:CHAT domain-containing protein, partial [Bacteroidota bacterium]